MVRRHACNNISAASPPTHLSSNTMPDLPPTPTLTPTTTPTPPPVWHFHFSTFRLRSCDEISDDSAATMHPNRYKAWVVFVAIVSSIFVVHPLISTVLANSFVSSLSVFFRCCRRLLNNILFVDVVRPFALLRSPPYSIHKEFLITSPNEEDWFFSGRLFVSYSNYLFHSFFFFSLLSLVFGCGCGYVAFIDCHLCCQEWIAFIWGGCSMFAYHLLSDHSWPLSVFSVHVWSVIVGVDVAAAGTYPMTVIPNLDLVVHSASSFYFVASVVVCCFCVLCVFEQRSFWFLSFSFRLAIVRTYWRLSNWMEII